MTAPQIVVQDPADVADTCAGRATHLLSQRPSPPFPLPLQRGGWLPVGARRLTLTGEIEPSQRSVGKPQKKDEQRSVCRAPCSCASTNAVAAQSRGTNTAQFAQSRRRAYITPIMSPNAHNLPRGDGLREFSRGHTAESLRRTPRRAGCVRRTQTGEFAERHTRRPDEVPLFEHPLLWRLCTESAQSSAPPCAMDAFLQTHIRDSLYAY